MTGAQEAIGIFLRFALSAMICQIVVNMELGNMRYELDVASDISPTPG